VFVAELALERCCGGCDGLLATPFQSGHVLGVGRVDERPGELQEERIEPAPQLQSGLAGTARVKIRAGTKQEGLADIDLLSAAEHRGKPLLRAQLFFAPARSRRAAPDIDVVGNREPSRGNLFAAAIADSHQHRALGSHVFPVWVRACHRVRVQGPVDKVETLGDEGVDSILCLERLRQP